MPFTTVTKIRFGDVDYAQIVYYPRFFYLFQLAVEDFFDDCLQLPYARALQKENLAFPAVHAEADYHSPLRFGDIVEIEVGIGHLGNKSVEFIFAVRRRGEDRVCAHGRLTAVAVRLDTMSGIPIPRQYREAFARYRAEQGSVSLESSGGSTGLQD